MMTRVDFAVIGAQKCATSWLYYCLRDHPEILLPGNKDEEDYFGGPRHLERGDEWFEGLFVPQPGAARRGSVSVNYLHDGAALRRLCSAFPEIRLVASLRHPIGRTVSACDFLVRRSKLPLEEASELVWRALDDVEAARDTPEAELVTRSLYGRQLQVALEAGSSDRILVVSFEGLGRDPSGAIETIYRFLTVSDPTFAPPSLSARPKQSTHLGALTRMERIAPRSRILAKVMDLSHRGLSRLGFGGRPNALSDDVDARFRRLLADDLKLMRQCLERIPSSCRWGSELDEGWGLESGE